MCRIPCAVKKWGRSGRCPAVFMDERSSATTRRPRPIKVWGSRSPAHPQRSLRAAARSCARIGWAGRRLKIRKWSSISRRAVPTQRSAKAFARGARTGSRTTLTPSLRKTSSKARVNFASRSRRRKPGRSSPSAIFQDRFRACCPTHAADGWAVQPARWTRRLPSSRKKST